MLLKWTFLSPTNSCHAGLRWDANAAFWAHKWQCPLHWWCFCLSDTASCGSSAKAPAPVAQLTAELSDIKEFLTPCLPFLFPRQILNTGFMMVRDGYLVPPRSWSWASLHRLCKQLWCGGLRRTRSTSSVEATTGASTLTGARWTTSTPGLWLTGAASHRRSMPLFRMSLVSAAGSWPALGWVLWLTPLPSWKSWAHLDMW